MKLLSWISVRIERVADRLVDELVPLAAAGVVGTSVLASAGSGIVVLAAAAAALLGAASLRRRLESRQST